MDAQRDRARGSLLGLALGDAFGSPVEGWIPADIQGFFGGYAALPKEWPAEARGLPLARRKRLRPLGFHAAVTQQALALYTLSSRDEGWSARDWADWLIEGFEREAWRGSDLHFMTAVHGLRRGRDHRGSGTPFPSAVPAARVGPIGSLLTDDPDALCDLVYEATLVTHADLRAAAMAHGVAYTTASLVRGMPVATIRETLGTVVREGERRWAKCALWDMDRSGGGRIPDALDALFACSLGSPVMVRSAVIALAEAHLRLDDGVPEANGERASLGALHGLAMALRDEATPDETLATVVGQGHAAAVAGAICGSVLGARFGAGWIESGRLCDGARISVYGDALAEHQAVSESREAFMVAEAELTREAGVFAEEMVAERRTGRPRPMTPPV